MKVLRLLDRTIEYWIAIIFISMVIIGGLQVFNRFILNQSLSWSEEFQKYAHIWLIFFTIPVAYRRGSHIGMRVLFEHFPEKMKFHLEWVFDLLWLFLGCAVVFYSLRIMQVAAQQQSAGLGIPMSYVYIGLVGGGIYWIIVALRQFTGRITSTAGE
jgi:TRAP-type transport system small permease protein